MLSQLGTLAVTLALLSPFLRIFQFAEYHRKYQYYQCKKELTDRENSKTIDKPYWSEMTLSQVYALVQRFDIDISDLTSNANMMMLFVAF